jgi:MFS family permease
MTSVAVAVQVYSLTHSSLAVGLTGLFVAVPLITMGLLGGSFADAVDRRKLVLVTSSLLAVLSLVFAVQALLDLRQLWLLYSLIALESSCFRSTRPPAGPSSRVCFRPHRSPQPRRWCSCLSR